MIYVEPCKGRVQQFVLNGTDLTQYVHCVRIYESVCKPYRTAQIVIYDNNNIIDTMDVEPMQPALVNIISPPNANAYNCSPMQVLKLKGEQVPDTLKYQIYYLDLIGPVYYQDRYSNIIDGSYMNISGTAAVQQIWGEYLNSDTLQILTSGSGLIGTMQTPYTTSQKPLTAIYDILKKISSDQNATTGNWLLFRDNQNVKLAQLSQLFSSLGIQQTFFQKEGWSASFTAGQWGSGFNDPQIYQAVIVAQAEAGRGDGGWAAGGQIAAAMSLRQLSYDLAKGQIMGTSAAQAQSFAGLLSGAGSGGPGQGSIGGYQITDTSRWADGGPINKTIGEQSYSAMVRNGPQMTLKVPLQTGISCTVGQGVYVNLIPPLGNQGSAGNPNSYLLSGSWLVSDLVHELYTDERQCAGTTSFQLMKGPLS